MSGSTFTIRLLGATATLMLVAACGSNSVSPVSSNKAATPGSGASATTSAAALGVAKTALGPVLVDSKGFTVYLLTADSPGHSTCSATCLQYWPLVAAPAGSSMPSVAGISAALKTTTAMSGASMVTAGGWPLYTFVKDKSPGDVTGQGVKTFGGTWYAVSPSGSAVRTAATPATTAPAAGSGVGGGGNGY